nr:hypothetical transcript [Hymenolepis microstoma]
MPRRSDLMPVVDEDWNFYNSNIGRMLTDSQYGGVRVEEMDHPLRRRIYLPSLSSMKFGFCHPSLTSNPSSLQGSLQH